MAKEKNAVTDMKTLQELGNMLIRKTDPKTVFQNAIFQMNLAFKDIREKFTVQEINRMQIGGINSSELTNWEIFTDIKKAVKKEIPEDDECFDYDEDDDTEIVKPGNTNLICTGGAIGNFVGSTGYQGTYRYGTWLDFKMDIDPKEGFIEFTLVRKSQRDSGPFSDAVHESNTVTVYFYPLLGKFMLSKDEHLCKIVGIDFMFDYRMLCFYDKKSEIQKILITNEKETKTYAVSTRDKLLKLVNNFKLDEDQFKKWVDEIGIYRRREGNEFHYENMKGELVIANMTDYKLSLHEVKKAIIPVNIKDLSLSNCNLDNVSLPPNIEKLDLNDCTKIDKFLTSMQFPKLKKLDIDVRNIKSGKSKVLNLTRLSGLESLEVTTEYRPDKYEGRQKQSNDNPKNMLFVKLPKDFMSIKKLKFSGEIMIEDPIREKHSDLYLWDFVHISNHVIFYDYSLYDVWDNFHQFDYDKKKKLIGGKNMTEKEVNKYNYTQVDYETLIKFLDKYSKQKNDWRVKNRKYRDHDENSSLYKTKTDWFPEIREWATNINNPQYWLAKFGEPFITTWKADKDNIFDKIWERNVAVMKDKFR
jgi:hypothetical protein